MSTDTSTNHRSSLYSTLDPRTQRAIDEPMTVITRGPGTYHVESASGATYIVHFPSESSSTEDGSPTCNCPDQTTPPSETDCKHLQRVKLDIACGELAHPNDWPSDAELAEREPTRPTDTSPPMPSPVATDGGQALGTAPSSTSIGASPEIATEEPTVIDERPGEVELDAPRDICHRISERQRFGGWIATNHLFANKFILQEMVSRAAKRKFVGSRLLDDIWRMDQRFLGGRKTVVSLQSGEKVISFKTAAGVVRSKSEMTRTTALYCRVSTSEQQKSASWISHA